MPFDSTPQKTITRLGKLERLLWLAERATGDQRRACECLHHDACADADLLASGMPATWQRGILNATEKWLGLVEVDGERIFGLNPIASKIAYLRDLIARERAGKRKGEQR